MSSITATKTTGVCRIRPGCVYRITHPTPFAVDSWCTTWRTLCVGETILVFRADIGSAVCHVLSSSGLVGSAHVDVLRNNCLAIA